MLPTPTPRARGFRWPAEWEPHEATLLAWPHDETTFPHLDHAEAAFATFAAAVSRGETVHLLVGDEAMERRAQVALREADAGDVRLQRIETADVWLRDYGPITLVKGTGAQRERLSLDFTFNAWGRKYPSLCADDRIPARLEHVLGIERLDIDLVLEGGSIDGDGEGTLLTTEQCLLHENRNPHLTRAHMEDTLREALGVRKVLWLGEGIDGDDTDGHVDDITRFVGPGRVVTAVHPDPADPDHGPLAENLRRLQGMSDAHGRALEVMELPMPEPVLGDDGTRLPASHANFYVANEVVCVPVFGGASDEVALSVLAGCFPGRALVPIPCRRVVEGLGALHCVSQQVPS